MDNNIAEYHYSSPEPTWAAGYLWKPVQRIIESANLHDRRIFEVGCGNGATAAMLATLGYALTAIDPSRSGIEIASRSFPQVTFGEGSAYEDLAARYGTFPCVISLEVVEHCFWSRRFAKTIFDLLEPGGIAIVSAPYHGYVKNLALALAGKFDAHWAPLWDEGHVKFWSRRTLGRLLADAGFSTIRFQRVGRLSCVAKSMIAIAGK